jgi:protease-4
VTKSNAQAVILSINSPGGTTTGSERLYKELRILAAKKPVIAIVGDVAASGAYIAALGSDHILASGNSLVGSIGVLFQYPNVARLLDNIGVKVEEVKSSPLKAAPNGLEPTSPEARAALAALVSDSFNWFKSLVEERRNLTEAELNLVADGRVFTGRQALPLKLIDGIGDEKEALDWLHESKKLAADLPVRDWKVKKSTGRLGIFGFSADLAHLLGYNGLAQSLEKIDLSAHQAALDGLLVIWQAGSASGS